jgi:O-antigen ligase
LPVSPGVPSGAADRPSLSWRGSEEESRAPPWAHAPNHRRRRRAARILPLLAEGFSIEASFALFLFSGWYKDLWELRGFPVDYTLFFFVVTLCLIAGAILSGRMKPVSPSLPVLLMTLFIGLAAASLSWSSLEAVNVDKAQRFILLTGTSFFAAHVIAQDRVRRRRLTRMLVWFSSAFLLYYVYLRYGLGINMQAGSDMGSDNYLEYGSDASILFITCLTLAAFGSPQHLYGVVLGAGAALYALLIMGGRGPLAVALLALPLLLLGLIRRRTRSLRRLALLSGLIALAAVGYVALVPGDGSSAYGEGRFRTLERYQAQLSREDTTSMDERGGGRDLAYRMWLEEPVLGWGIGEFKVIDTYLEYPHNLLLEILAEMGIVGAFLFFPICAVAVRDCVRIAGDRACDWVDAAIALLFLTELASHLTVQGYLADDRIFFAYIGLVIGSRTAVSRAIRPATAFSGALAPRIIARPPRERLMRKSMP